MAILAAVVDVLDANGASVVPNNADGTRPLVKLAVDATIAPTVTRSGDTAIVRLGANGSASVAGQAIAPASIVTTGNVTVGGILYIAPSAAIVTTNATPADIGSPIPIPAGAPNSVAVIYATFIGRDAIADGTIVLRRLYTVGRAGSADVAGSMPQVLGTDIITQAADTGATTNGRVIGGTLQLQATGVAGQTIRWRLFIDRIDLFT